MKIISDSLQETKMLFVDRSVKINLLCKFYETEKYLPELTLSHFIPRRTTMATDQITVLLYFVGQRDWGKGRVVEMCQLKIKTIVSCF